MVRNLFFRSSYTYLKSYMCILYFYTYICHTSSYIYHSKSMQELSCDHTSNLYTEIGFGKRDERMGRSWEKNLKNPLAERLFRTWSVADSLPAPERLLTLCESNSFMTYWNLRIHSSRISPVACWMPWPFRWILGSKAHSPPGSIIYNNGLSPKGPATARSLHVLVVL